MKTLPLIRYGLLALPLAFLGLPLYVYVPPLYGNIEAIGLTLTGLVLLLARSTDFLTDPLMGWVYDRWRKRLSARFWMLLGSPLLMAGVWWLFHPGPQAGWLDLLLSLLLLNLGFTLIAVPYYAAAVELAPQAQAQRRVAMWREALMLLGVLLALFLPVMWPQYSPLSVLAVTFLGLLPVTLLWQWSIHPRAYQAPSLSNSQNLPQDAAEQTQLALRQAMKALLQLQFWNALAAALPAGLFLFYVQEVLQLSLQQAGLLLVLYFFGGLLAAPVWLRLARHFSAISLWKSSLLLASVAFLPAAFLNAESVWLFVLVCLVSGFSLSADVVFPISLQGQMAAQYSQQSGQSRGGAALGWWGMVNKLALAVSAAVALPLLEILSSRFGRASALPFLYAGLPVLFKLWTWWLLRRHTEGLQSIPLQGTPNDDLQHCSAMVPDPAVVERGRV